MGSSVTYEDNGKDKIHYTYDSSGKLISMNLNGSEYYYVRNAQGDIIGLINAQGEKVVSYTYDSWGKLISIEGSLKDTVGEKNPYRYRGYRYDSETGLYYLQSRYYNPEWRRFINADGIIGETGELLGHNLFAYSKNNWANMSDYRGFRPVYTLGEETEAMRAASYAVMNRTRANRAVNSSRCVNTSSKHKITKREYLGTAKNVIKNIGMAYSGYIAQELSKPISIAFNRAMRRAGQYIVIPGSKIAKGALIGFTVFGITDTVLSVRKNFRESKSLGEAWGKSVIDVGVSVTSFVVGYFASPIGGAVAGVGISLVGDLTKNFLWDD